MGRSRAEVQVPAWAPAVLDVQVAVGAAAERAPETCEAEQHEETAARAVGARRDCRGQDPAEHQRQDHAGAEQERVADSELTRGADDARATDAGAAVNGQRGDRHEVIGAEAVQKSERERGAAEQQDRHQRIVILFGDTEFIRIHRVARILIVEDSADIADLVAHYLQRAGHDVDRLASGSAVTTRVRATRPDLIVLDLMLPGMDGLAVCQALRSNAATAATPIIMLTARSEEKERVHGLELGADDYVTKPFSPKELVARVGALLRRLERPAPRPARVQYGPITVDADRHQVACGQREVRLTAKEFLLLQYLIEHRGRVLSRDLLLTDVWGYHYTGGTRTVDVHVRRLREKLPFLETALVTIKQFGYRLDDPAPVHS
jgi:two-component system, OmpR family, alkaline phosphatase synthesis response regulator PhoP